MDLLKTLIISSEKAANIARLLRQNEKLFQKLVEQKSTAEANPRFQEDFKTLADVLIQEMVKHEVGLKFPLIRHKVYGEESNHFFSRDLDKDIIVEVKDSQEETATLLNTLFDDQDISNILAAEVHKEVTLEEVNTRVLPEEFNINIDTVGIWIDPIDGTNEYVKEGFEEKCGDFYLKGLKCVTVLIGVYDNSGQPVMGVINQPFFEKGIDTGYQCHWGICDEPNNDLSQNSSIDKSEWKETNTIVIGSSESELVKQTLREGGYSLVVTRGAGYKLLNVILGTADAYILSKPTTFSWDTCAPQAILRAIGGNVIQMDGILTNQKNYVTYTSRDDNSKCNKNGIIAYRNETVLDKLFSLPWTK